MWKMQSLERILTLAQQAPFFMLSPCYKDLSFEIANSFIMIHFRCFEMSLYVLMAYVIFQQTINNVQRQCFEAHL
jgi:hypothetical protein